MSLRAHRALGLALGELLRGGTGVPPVISAPHGRDAHATPDAARPATLLAEATDAIDDGLALARYWEIRDSPAQRPLAARLFRLGAQLYRVHQPQFLAEFLLENLAFEAFAGDAGFRAAADEALTLALADLQKPQLLVLGDVASARLLATARSLRAAQQQLSRPPKVCHLMDDKPSRLRLSHPA